MTTSRFCKDTKVFSIRNVMKNLWWVETKSSLSLSLSDNYHEVFDIHLLCTWQANFARWEPCHGQFHFRHPWKQYLKIGILTRECAYRIDALSGHLNSDIRVILKPIYHI